MERLYTKLHYTVRYEMENESEPATKSAANSELKAVNRTVHRAVDITDDNDDDDDDEDDDDDGDSAAAILLLVVSNKSLLSMTRSSTHWHLHSIRHNTLSYRYLFLFALRRSVKRLVAFVNNRIPHFLQKVSLTMFHTGAARQDEIPSERKSFLPNVCYMSSLVRPSVCL